MSIKSEVKRCVSGAIQTRRIIKENAEIRNYIKNSEEPVPELQEQQKKEILAYWEQYGIQVKLDWHKLFYAKTGLADPHFVPRTVFNYIVKVRMNDDRFVRTWSDKAYLDYFVHDVLTPECPVRNVSGRFLDQSFRLISAKEAADILQGYDRLVVKPAVDTDTGKGIKLLTKPYHFEELFREYGQNYVFQLPIAQYEGMKCFNASSVNTIRMNTVLLDTKAHVMSCFVKVGEAGKFADNNGKNRYFIGIDPETGILNNYAIDHALHKYTSIPSNYSFQGQAIPHFSELCAAVCRAHEQLAHFGFAFFDVALNADGQPVVIEVNLRRPDTNVAQCTGTPFFGKYTDTILKRICRS